MNIHLDTNNQQLVEGKRYEITLNAPGLLALYKKHPQFQFGRTTLFNATFVDIESTMWFQIPSFGPKILVNPSFCTQIKPI